MVREYFYSAVIRRAEGCEDRVCGVWICSKEISHKDVLAQIVESFDSEKYRMLFVAFNALPIRD